MNPGQLERLSEHLLKLRLLKSHERLEALLQHAAEKELAYSDFLEQVLGEEVAAMVVLRSSPLPGSSPRTGSRVHEPGVTISTRLATSASRTRWRSMEAR